MFIDNVVKEKLAGVKDFSEYFTSEEFAKWLDLVKTRHNIDDSQLRKTLGIAYQPTLNHIDGEDGTRADILTQLGLGDASDEYISKLGYLMYREEDFKSYGNAEVTESLNYFEFEDGETVKSYYALTA